MDTNPDYYDFTFKDIVKIALLNLYKEVKEKPKKDLNLINNPNGLGNFNVDIKYRDDITDRNKKGQKIIDWEETQERHS